MSSKSGAPRSSIITLVVAALPFDAPPVVPPPPVPVAPSLADTDVIPGVVPTPVSSDPGP